MPIHPAIHNSQLRETMKAEGLECISFLATAADDDHFKASTAPTAGANATTTCTTWTKASCLEWPVVPVIVVTDAAADDWTAVVIVIKGYDQFGDFRTESVTATGSSGTWTGTAVNAFATLISAAITITGTATSADRYKIGYAKTWGIGRKLGASGDLISVTFDGAADTGTASAAYSTFAVNGTPNAAKVLTFCVRPSYYLR